MSKSIVETAVNRLSQAISDQLRKEFGDNYSDAEKDRRLRITLNKYVDECIDKTRQTNSVLQPSQDLSAFPQVTENCSSIVKTVPRTNSALSNDYLNGFEPAKLGNGENRTDQNSIDPSAPFSAISVETHTNNESNKINARREQKSTSILSPPQISNTRRRSNSSGGSKTLTTKPKTVCFLPSGREAGGRQRFRPKPATNFTAQLGSKSNLQPVVTMVPATMTMMATAANTQPIRSTLNNFEPSSGSSSDSTIKFDLPDSARGATPTTTVKPTDALWQDITAITQLVLRQDEAMDNTNAQKDVSPHSTSHSVPIAHARPSTRSASSRKHRRVYCPHCDRHTGGFRGQHELERHIHREHFESRQVFYAVDISKEGNYLSACNNCRKRKMYNTDYNCAAHLRRFHFNKKLKTDSDEEKIRKSSSNSPTMEECRRWMRKATVDKNKIADKKFLSGQDEAILGYIDGEEVTSPNGIAIQDDDVELADGDTDLEDTDDNQDADTATDFDLGSQDGSANNYTHMPSTDGDVPYGDQSFQFDSSFEFMSPQELNMFCDSMNTVGVDISQFYPVSYAGFGSTSNTFDSSFDMSPNEYINFDVSPNSLEAQCLGSSFSLIGEAFNIDNSQGCDSQSGLEHN